MDSRDTEICPQCGTILANKAFLELVGLFLFQHPLEQAFVLFQVLCIR